LLKHLYKVLRICHKQFRLIFQPLPFRRTGARLIVVVPPEQARGTVFPKFTRGCRPCPVVL